jgi:hypothetical protein
MGTRLEGLRPFQPYNPTQSKIANPKSEIRRRPFQPYNTKQRSNPMNRRPVILLLLLIIAGFAFGGFMNRRLVDQRRDYGITQADPLVNAPPLVVFTTVAFGGFRGIVADLLWLRSSRLQEEGKYFELVQLADWITKLEPRFTQVWAYHAWNLAYNISVLFDDPESRWRWVRHGFSMLRDEGLRYNPGEPGLLFELGWIFQHKLGGDTDDAHRYYKRAWAEEMEALFPGGRPDFAAIERDPELRRRMQDDYKLDPARINTIASTYGPLDWRLPATHAIYWAQKSREVATGIDIIFAERMIYQSMSESMRLGRLFRPPGEADFILTPDLDHLPAVRATFRRFLAGREEPFGLHDAYRFFLREAVFYAFLYGRFEEAESCLAELKTIAPDIPADVDAQRFVLEILSRPESERSSEQVFAMVESAFYRAAIAGMSGDQAAADELETIAEQTWREFVQGRKWSPEVQARIGLPPIDVIRASAKARLQKD